MKKLKLNKVNKRRYKGTVYVLRIRLKSGEVVHKIGMTTRKVQSRIAELVVDYYMKYGYIPMVEVVRKEKSRWYVEVEQLLLSKSEHWKYEASKQIDGVTEYRKGMNEKLVCEWYDGLIVKEDWPEGKDNAKEWKIQAVGLNDMDPVNYGG